MLWKNQVPFFKESMEHEHHHDHDHEHEHHHDHDHECEHHHDHDHECEHHHDHDHECEHHHDHEHEHDHNHECCCGHHHEHGHHHADEVFTSWGEETPKKFTEDEIKSALDKLANTTEYGTILRAKGMVPNVNGEWIYFDLVPGEYEVRKGQPEVTGRICVIGTNPEPAKLKELFGI